MSCYFFKSVFFLNIYSIISTLFSKKISKYETYSSIFDKQKKVLFDFLLLHFTERIGFFKTFISFNLIVFVYFFSCAKLVFFLLSFITSNAINSVYCLLELRIWFIFLFSFFPVFRKMCCEIFLSITVHPWLYFFRYLSVYLFMFPYFTFPYFT